MEWWQRDHAPTRQEAERDAMEEHLIRTYEERFTDWCEERGLDPEDVGSVLAYEDEWMEQP